MVVFLELDPRLVIGHFLLSMVLLWNAVVLHHKAGHQAGHQAGDSTALLAAPPAEAVEAPIALARTRGGHDNITVIALRLPGP